MRSGASGVSALPLDRPALLHERTLCELGPHAPRFALEVVAECGSTNDELSLAATRTDERIAVLVALHQRAGRGRRGRAWHAGDGLAFSCAWPIAPDAPPPSALSLAAGLAVAEAIEDLGVRDVALKWPNDVLVDGRKIAGILVELVSGQRRTRHAIIGIGANLGSVPEYPPDGGRAPTAIAEHLAVAPAIETVLATILIRLAGRLDAFAAGGFAAMHHDWSRRDAFAGQLVRIDGEGASRSGRCEGVDADGALRLATESGLERILSGELSLRSAA